MNGLRALIAFVAAASCAGCSSGPPGCSDSDVQDIVLDMLNGQAPILAIAVNPIAGRALLADPAVLAAMNDEEYGKAFEAVRANVQKGNDDFWLSVVAAAAQSRVRVSAVTTTDSSEHKSECELTAEFHLGFPSPSDIRNEYTAKLMQPLDALRTLHQQRTYEAFYNDDGEVMVRLFPAE